jgi:uncharacterized LabA/DUF88 family protein
MVAQKNNKFLMRTAILIDGGFYRKRSNFLFGAKSPKERAEELQNYCYEHLRDNYEKRFLYRIFYYDCPPVSENAWHPLFQKTINLGKTPQYTWSNEFLQELKHRRKFALRMGRLSEKQLYYTIKYESLKKLISGTKSLKSLNEDDFKINIEQKGVDMKIGIDISSLCFKKQVNQIILISGDSDFVPAAKQARREGIDFILDPMGASIKSDLFEHIDGIRSKYKYFLSKNSKE